MRDLDIDLLRAFVTIADVGGFTRAASRLGRTQSTISLQIKRLEDGLGAPVFVRGGRRLELTSEGRILLEYARQMLRLSDEARSRIGQSELVGCIRLGCPETLLTTDLLPILSDFTDSHPHLELDIHCDLSRHVEAAFEAGRVDVALVEGPGDRLASAIDLRLDPLVWICRDGWSPLVDVPVPLVVRPDPCNRRRCAVDSLERARRSWRPAVVSPGLSGVNQSVRSGLGVTVTTRSSVPDGCRILAPNESGLPNPGSLTVAVRVRSDAAPATNLFTHHLRTAFGMPIQPESLEGIDSHSSNIRVVSNS